MQIGKWARQISIWYQSDDQKVQKMKLNISWPTNHRFQASRHPGIQASRHPDSDFMKIIQIICVLLSKVVRASVSPARERRDMHEVLQIAAKRSGRVLWMRRETNHSPFFPNTVRTPTAKDCLGNKSQVRTRALGPVEPLRYIHASCKSDCVTYVRARCMCQT